jgi:glycosyltransferase involved in cell wall biosynthesis
MSREKGYADLAPALLELRRRRPELLFWCVLVGDGAERARVARAAASVGVADRLLLTGHRVDAQAFFALADVFVLPSHSEGAPNVLLESMAAGAPIVAARAGGVPEMVRDQETALLVPPKQPPALAAALERVLTTPELAAQLAAQALGEVRERFSPSRRQDRLEAIYSEAFRRR